MESDSTTRYDVAIVGCGFEGSLLGIVLASQGLNVLMIDSGTHPRFALGESTVRHTFKILKMIGERYQVREILEKFSRAEQVHTHVTSSSGVKKNFGYLYHREGQHQNPEEANQVVITPFREGHEAHLYRQDIDAWLTYTAVHYGATVKYKTLIKEVEIDTQGVTLQSSTGETFKARYLVDAAGPGAFLGRLFNLRDEPPRLKLNTRCLFTHMVDVKSYDDLDLPHGKPDLPLPLYSGTTHHLFDGGWLWVIPFNNREGSTNPLVSIGLSFDNARFPRPKDMSPQEEWEQFLTRFPDIHAQFKDARVTRDWISTDRLQSSCRQTVGERWCLTSGANGSGFMDALFSRGLANSVEFVAALVPRLIQALKDDDFSVQRFEYLERLTENNLCAGEQIIRSAYTSFRDYDLWNAWFRVWALGVGLGDLWLAMTLRNYQLTRDESLLPDAKEPSLFFSHHDGYKAFFQDAVATLDAVEAGTLATKDAARHIFNRLNEIEFASPAFRLGDPARKFVNIGDRAIFLQTMAWLATSAPPEIKERSIASVADIPKRVVSRIKARGAAPLPVRA